MNLDILQNLTFKIAAWTPKYVLHGKKKMKKKKKNKVNLILIVKCI